MFEKIFETDAISKRRRVDLTLNHQPVDRVAIFEQLSYNSHVIALLIAILVPALRMAKDFTKTVVCAAQLKKRSYMFYMYSDDPLWPTCMR